MDTFLGQRAKLGVCVLMAGGIFLGLYKCESDSIDKMSDETGLDLYSIVDVVPIKGLNGKRYLYAECEGINEQSNNMKYFVEYEVSSYHYEKFTNIEEYSHRIMSSKKADELINTIVPEYQPTGIFSQEELNQRLAEIQYSSEFKETESFTK